MRPKLFLSGPGRLGGLRLVLTGALVVGVASASLAADVLYYSLVKGRYYNQSDAGPPVLRSFRPYFFRASVLAVSNNLLMMARVQLPNGSSWGMMPVWVGDRAYEGRWQEKMERLRTQEELNIAYPEGTYTFNFMTLHDGMKNLSLSLTGEVYPQGLKIANWEEAQQIVPEEDFFLRWDPPANSTTHDWIELRILDSAGLVFRTGLWPGETNVINGTATSVRIPSQTLKRGRRYVGKLCFYKVVTNVTAYAWGQAGYASQVDFYLATAGAEGYPLPQVVRLFPPDSCAQVPLNMRLWVEFNQPMDTGFVISLVGATNQVSAAFSADRRSCYFYSSNLWPANKTVTFCLNPIQGMLYTGSTNRTPLLPDTVFTLNFGNSILPTNATPPLCRTPVLVNPRAMLFELAGEAFRSYTLQASSNFVDWTNLGTVQSSAGVISITQAIDPAALRQFFRVLANP